MGRVYLRQSNGTRLIALCDHSPLTEGSGDQQALINVFCGVWLEDQGEEEEAIKAFRRAFKVGRSAQRQQDALWRIGWRRYQQRKYSQAIVTYQKILSGSGPPEGRAQASYWMARSMDHLNQRKKAQVLYQELAQDLPFTYYGQLAQSRLENPMSNLVTVKEDSEFHQTNYQRSSIIREDFHYQKSVALAALELFEEAGEELNSIVKVYSSDQDAIKEILSLAQQIHALETGIRTAIRNFSQKLQKGSIPKSSFVWKAAYPTGYLHMIEGYAPPKLDPYLVAGIIREESLYNARAVSRVGALGLMQLMPYTASKVARKLEMELPDREALFDPDTNIRLGTFYVNQLLGRYKNNLVYSVAAYNAGPNAVGRWISRHGRREPDEFVELISYRETRGYVKRVLGSYRIYHVLANDACRVRSLDTRC